MSDKSVNVLDLVAEIESLATKVATDAKAVEPLVQKTINLLKTVEFLDPQIKPVVDVAQKVLNIVSEVLARV